MHDYISGFLTELDSKEPYINMAGSFSGYNGVNNINSRIIVFIACSRRFMGKPNLLKHTSQEYSILVSSYSNNKL